MMLLSAGVLASPRFVPSAYASFGGCEVVCTSGGCKADPDPGETCHCGCTWWGGAKCTCTEALRPANPN